MNRVKHLSDLDKTRIIQGLGSSDINLMLYSRKGFDEQLRFMWDYAQQIEKPTYVALEEGADLPDEVKESPFFFGSATFRRSDRESVKDCTKKLIRMAEKSGHVRDAVRFDRS